MLFHKSRTEIDAILNQVVGVDVVPEFPGTNLTKPVIVYTRVATARRLQGSGVGPLDELTGYALHIIASSLLLAETIADEADRHMTEAGYSLVSAVQNGPQSCLLTYMRTVDRQSNVAHGRNT